MKGKTLTWPFGHALCAHNWGQSIQVEKREFIRSYQGWVRSSICRLVCTAEQLTDAHIRPVLLMQLLIVYVLLPQRRNPDSAKFRDFAYEWTRILRQWMKGRDAVDDYE